jgi:hypothetical protein
MPVIATVGKTRRESEVKDSRACMSEILPVEGIS